MVADWCFVTTLASGTAEAVSKSHPTDTSRDHGDHRAGRKAPLRLRLRYASRPALVSQLVHHVRGRDRLQRYRQRTTPFQLISGSSFGIFLPTEVPSMAGFEATWTLTFIETVWPIQLNLPQKSSPLKPAGIRACLARSDSGCGKFVANFDYLREANRVSKHSTQRGAVNIFHENAVVRMFFMRYDCFSTYGLFCE